MAKNNNNNNNKARDMANYVFWIFLVQGIAFLLLAYLILTNPLFLYLWIALNLLLSGITTLLLAYRVRRFHGEVAEIMA